MLTINALNAFFNIVYDNQKAIVRALKDQTTLNELKALFKIKQIDDHCIHTIDVNGLQLISLAKSLEEIEAVLHIPLIEQIEQIQQTFNKKTNIVLINTNLNLNFNVYQDTFFYEVNIDQENNTLYDPFAYSFKALTHLDCLPGVLIFNQNESHFESYQDNMIQQIKTILDLKKDLIVEFKKKQIDNQDSYFMHISDLHIGKESNNQGLSHLIESLDHFISMLETSYPIKFLITGDLMESPKVKNMVLSRNFMNQLKKRYHADVTFVLGNHDVIVHGLNLNRTQKSKVVANLLSESIKVLEDEKLILIKMDTCVEGNLARGKVGQRQFDEIDEELDTIDHIEEYTILVLMHHHLYEIQKSDFVKKKWHENIRLLDKLVDNSKALIDGKQLKEWLHAHKIHYVFHGHKHVPDFRCENGQYYIGAGKATGGLKESKSRYISYNIVKYSHLTKQMQICLVLYYDKKEDNRLRVEYHTFGGNL